MKRHFAYALILSLFILAPIGLASGAPLHDAAKNGDINAVKALLNKGADVNEKSGEYQGATALIFAAANGHADVVKLLIEKGADVNEKDIEGGTALMLAAELGHPDVVKLLVEKGADVNDKTNDGRTALMLAAWKGHPDVVKLLVEKGANLDYAILKLESYSDIESKAGARMIKRIYEEQRLQRK